MNETDVLNVTGNETVRQGLNQTGSVAFDAAKAVDTILNNDLTTGIASVANSFFHTNFFSGSFVVAGLLVLALIWKWQSVAHFISTFGTYLLVSVLLFLMAKQLGVL